MEIRILETPDEMEATEVVSRQVWPGSETDIVPAHLLVTLAHNGGVIIGAFDDRDQLVGYTFGFPGLEDINDVARGLKFCSHQLGVLPELQGSGLGFRLKRAQWQIARRQGFDHITWTYDPLLSMNANLNIAKLGAVCNTYLREVYGEMRDGLNAGLPSDRFQVDWWLNTPRVQRKLDRHPPQKLDLAHYLSADVPRANQTTLNDAGFPVPQPVDLLDFQPAIVLLEIPADFYAVKRSDPALALEWRLHTRAQFETLFARGYLVTDFVFLPGSPPRSYYVLSDGEATF